MGPPFRIYKELSQLNNIRQPSKKKKKVKDLKRHFSKEEIQRANRLMERFVMLLVKQIANQNHNEIPFHTH